VSLRCSLAALIAVGAVMVGATPAGAIVSGTIDTGPNPRYPQVGALGYEDPESGLIFQACTVSLVGKGPETSVLLTAAHCVLPPQGTIWISFDADVQPEDPAVDWFAATGFAAIGGALRNSGNKANDLAVVYVRSADLPAGLQPLPIAEEGALSALRAAGALKGRAVTVVGYGCTRLQHQGGPKGINCDSWARHYATAPFRALRPNDLQLSGNVVQSGLGGSCYGDSGGPSADRRRHRRGH
jgi:trypsin